MADLTNREEFLRTIRVALGRSGPVTSVQPPPESGLSLDAASVARRAGEIRETMAAKGDELMAEMAGAATKAGWSVATVADATQAREYILGVARKDGAKSVMRSAHEAVNGLGLEAAMAGAGVDIRLMAVDGVGEAETQRKALREQALRSDIGITGIDYAIAETGSVAIVARKGVSRLVSLVMPVHIAVVMRGQVLPSLDELFTLRRHDFNQGNLGSYMNIITGPSRSADIEQTIVKGVHGPREVHMVLVDR